PFFSVPGTVSPSVRRKQGSMVAPMLISPLAQVNVVHPRSGDSSAQKVTLSHSQDPSHSRDARTRTSPGDDLHVVRQASGNISGWQAECSLSFVFIERQSWARERSVPAALQR